MERAGIKVPNPEENEAAAHDGGDQLMGLLSNAKKDVKKFRKDALREESKDQDSPLSPRKLGKAVEKDTGGIKKDADGGFVQQFTPNTVQAYVSVIRKEWYDNVKVVPPPVDTSAFSTKELFIMLENQQLMKVLGRAGIRPDMILMLFQKLDVFSEGVVHTEDFVESLSRLRMGVQGIDVASSKSNMRKLWKSMHDMQCESGSCYDVYLRTACDIRGITSVGSDRNLHHDEDTDEDENDREENLDKKSGGADLQHIRLTGKIDSVTQYLVANTKVLETWGDKYASVAVGLHWSDMCFGDDEIVSIDSVDPNAD